MSAVFMRSLHEIRNGDIVYCDTWLWYLSASVQYIPYLTGKFHSPGHYYFLMTRILSDSVRPCNNAWLIIPLTIIRDVFNTPESLELTLNPTSGDKLSLQWQFVLTQPPIQWVTGALSPGVKRPDREADHSPPSTAEVKNAWSYTSTPQLRMSSWRGA